MSKARGRSLDGLEQVLGNSALVGAERRFVELCLELGDVKLAGQRSGIGSDYPGLKLGQLKQKYMPKESRSETATRQHVKRRDLEKAIERLRKMADDPENTPAARTYAATKIADIQMKAALAAAKADAAAKPADGVLAPVSIAPKIVDKWLPGVCPKCGCMVESLEQDAGKLMSGGKVR